MADVAVAWMAEIVDGGALLAAVEAKDWASIPVLIDKSGLTELNIDGAPPRPALGDKGAMAVGAALAVNNTLSSLKLFRNAIGDGGASAVAEALASNTVLESLDLQQNEIGNEGAAALGAALSTNKTLTYLNCNDNQIGAEGGRALAAALESNSSPDNKRIASVHKVAVAHLHYLRVVFSSFRSHAHFRTLRYV